MSDAAGNLRAAADYIDDARTYLEQGDLGAEVDEIQKQIERADDVVVREDWNGRTIYLSDEADGAVDGE